MKTPSPINTAPDHSAVTMRMRADLVFSFVTFASQPGYVAKDPIALTYFRMRPDELFVARELDGRKSLRQIRDAYNDRYAPQHVTLEELQALLYRFHAAGLVISDADNQAQQLQRRANRQGRARRWGNLASVLFIRFPGWDPERFLNRVYPLVGWLFSWWAVAIGLALVGCAGLWVLVNFGEFLNRIPALEEFFTVEHLIGWLFVISTTKILHELGHAIVCKRFGGECHEIGPMLLVFTPALYCDTSDSWMLASRWQRAAVGMAGIYVELVLSAIAVFVWWNTQPGFLHFACLQLIIVSSVSTLIFNGNPLLRYDGYYVLSDLLGEPNLADVSRKAMLQRLRTWALGIPSRSEPTSAERDVGRLVYAALSFCYRWFVLLSILFFLTRWLRPLGLEALGATLALASIVGMAVGPTHALYRWLENPMNLRQVNRRRATLSFLILVFLLTAISTLPVRNRIISHGVVRAASAKAVYVTVDGFADERMRVPGDIVAAGETLATLTSRELTLSLASIQAQRDLQARQLESMRALQTSDPQVAAEIPVAAAMLDELDDQLAQRKQQIAALTIVAPSSGRLIPPANRVEDDESQALREWHGQPSDRENRGCYLRAGTQLCSIAADDTWELQATVPAEKIVYVEPGDPVVVALEALPNHNLHGTVTRVAREQGDVELQPTITGDVYLANITLSEGQSHLLRPGMRGQASITAERQTIATYVKRWFASIWRFS